MSGKVRLILVDGAAVLYRSFYAIKGLSTRAGRPTNAVFGFIKKLRRIEEILNPTHWAVAFDAGIPIERTELLPEYKAQRPPMPDDLRGQVGLAMEYLDRADIPMLRQEGQEADDLIASVVAWAEPATEEVLIATSDKDLYQLVTDRVRILPLAGEERPMGPREVAEKTGVMPAQIPDWLALTGDSSDNIPGVPGVGPKTAAGLLARFGTTAGLLDRLEQIDKDRLRRSLQEHRDGVLRNLRLVALRRDAVTGMEWPRFQRVLAAPEKVAPFLRELEFESLARMPSQQELRLGQLGM
ncbi:MAG: 5'-3' exonuclease H3TH domain-containing protein [Verrucomicrobiota bacterium]|nr:5'-3' exonuclease H3TH domain-containing protein [Verrucomicrobiota bacterium]